MKLFLVRHTEYDNPQNIFPFHLPVTLSSIGRHNAQKIGDWFVTNNFSGLPIYTSPIVRTVQTAEIIAAKTNSPVTVSENLIETNCPGVEGQSKEIEKTNGWQYEFDQPSRETKEQVLERVLKTYQEKVTEGKDCILVSHGDPLTILWYHLQNKFMEEYLWDPKNLDNVVRRGEVIEIEIENGAVVKSTIVIEGTEAI